MKEENIYIAIIQRMSVNHWQTTTMNLKIMFMLN